MIEIIPVKERKEDQIDTAKRFYVDNTHGNSMSEKYNWAIENIVLKQSDDRICFRHEDTEIRTPVDFIDNMLSRGFENGVGVAGVIGTIELESSGTWWNPNRHINGSGSIIQGGKNEKGEPIEYPMNDHPGTHDYLATVDGCCLFINKKLFDEGIRFDETLKDFHFYDVDICCQALEKGYKVSTIEAVVKHNSQGIPPKNFEELRKVFVDKWTKKIDSWPISRLTVFH